MPDNRDAEGFLQLIRRTTVPTKIVDIEKEDKPSKKKWPKFDKGSWKAEMLKELRKHLVPKGTEDFHFIHTDNLVVSFGKKTRTFKFHNRLDLERLKSLAKGSDETKVLINAGDGEFLAVSAKSYIKLAGIDRLCIRFKLEANYDDDTTCTVYTSEHWITNVNELAWFLIHHRHCIAGVYDVQAECYGFADYAFKCKTMVIHRDRTVETWKDDLNGFMKKYHLKLF